MRAGIFKSVILFFFGALVLGLFYTQVLRYSSYEKLSEKNRIRVLPLEAPRGKIYDRKGTLLVSSRVSFDVEVVFQEIEDKEKAIGLCSDILGIDKEILSKKIDKAREMPFAPVRIVEDIEKDKAIQIEELKLDLPGVIVTTRPMRNYIYKNVLSHMTGYLGKISEAELSRYKTYGYKMRDSVGKDGIERSYNDYLRGIDGGLQAEVDSKGRQLRVLAIKEPQPGKNLHLTIDLELQKFCYSLLSEQRGAIVAMDSSTGEILTLVSRPDFDPNMFVSPNNFNEIGNLLRDSNAFPMLNRAISGTYAPGSVFKIVVATSALDSGKFSDKETFSCSGSFPVGNRVFRCWKENGHGNQHIIEAIKHSCNVFFYQLGLHVGANEMSRYAFSLGLGRVTGIDLPGEVSGFVPTPSWKRRKLRELWFKGETANYAIGQGYITVTPMQVLRLISTVANGGKLVQPFVVERIEDVHPHTNFGALSYNGRTKVGVGVKLHHAESQDTGLNEKTLTIVRKGLRSVVNDPHGTGAYAKSNEVVVAGKTGTAQNPHGESHAWFTGFAPFENPKISIVVFLEHGGKGGLAPALLTKKIIEEAKKLKLL